MYTDVYKIKHSLCKSASISVLRATDLSHHILTQYTQQITKELKRDHNVFG